MTLRAGSLCTGYAGLDMAAAAVFDTATAWVADPAPGAAAILAHHMPDVPNLGDITTTDWADVEPVDLITAGFPCQDISYAGRGAGIREGTRSGLWHTIADAVGVLRPRFLVLENVAAIVTRRPGLDAVLADLADLGFDAEWMCLRASDVGAPHRRNRWFLLATDADRAIGGQRRVATPGQTPSGRARPDPRGRGRAPAADGQGEGRQGPRTQPQGGRPEPGDSVAADPAFHRRDQGRPEPAGQFRRPDAALGGDAVADPQGVRHRDAWPAGLRGRRPPVVAGVVADADRDLIRQQPVGVASGGGQAVVEFPGVEWGVYGPAVHRWSLVVGRPAPSPVEPGRGGAPRLSPVFVEWFMGLAEGHVTAVPGVTRIQQLTALGNGVVPQQGAAAVAILLQRLTERCLTKRCP